MQNSMKTSEKIAIFPEISANSTKDAGVDLLIGYNTAIKSDYRLRLLEPLKDKGKDKPLEIYTWE